MKKHAKFSPSGADGWSACSEWASDPKGSDYANWGTAAHEIAEVAFTEDKPAAAYLGRLVEVDGQHYEVDDDMVECVQSFLDAKVDGETFVEQRLPISQITGEDDAHGTADRVTIAGDEIIIDDLKTGKGVKVDAENNKQLAIYAQAVVDQFSMLYDFTQVRMRIVQPRINHISEWALSVEALYEFVSNIKPATQVTPGEKQCRWCAKKATCKALSAQVLLTTGEPTDPEDERLAALLGQVDLIEDWCRAVRAESERRLFDGRTLPGWKLVEGKKGARAWTDDTAVETLFKSMRLRQEEMYQFKLISPTAAEKILKEQPKRWSRLQEFITQKSGSPAVVPATDKRPAIRPDLPEVTAIPETL